MIRKMSLNRTDPNQKEMVVKMKAKFDKYWGDVDSMNLVIFVACVMDPRYKLKYVSWLIRESYGSGSDTISETLIEKVTEAVKKMFDHYNEKFGCSKSNEPFAAGAVSASQVNTDDVEIYDLDSLIEQHETSEENSEYQSELESYLSDSCVSRIDPSFEVLVWWKKMESKYRILSLMARDLLAIPVSSVASESAFSTSGRVIDPYRSSLTPRTVEALICTQYWIRSDYEQVSLEEQFRQLEILEDELENSKEYGSLAKGINLSLEEEE